MNSLLHFSFFLVLSFIYGLLIYRIFVKRYNKWLRENIGLALMTMLMALPSNYSILVKSFIVLLSCGLIIILVYKKLKSRHVKLDQ